MAWLVEKTGTAIAAVGFAVAFPGFGLMWIGNELERWAYRLRYRNMHP